MSLYYFDLRDGGLLSIDEEGMDLPTMHAVQIEAARSLVDIAKHAVWSTAATVLGHQMAIEVRDGFSRIFPAHRGCHTRRRNPKLRPLGAWGFPERLPE